MRSLNSLTDTSNTTAKSRRSAADSLREVAVGDFSAWIGLRTDLQGSGTDSSKHRIKCCVQRTYMTLTQLLFSASGSEVKNTLERVVFIIQYDSHKSWHRCFTNALVRIRSKQTLFPSCL